MIKKIISILEKEAKDKEEKNKIEELEKIVDSLENNDEKFAEIRKVFPNIFKNKETMLHLISEDENLLKYDETNHPEVYITALKLKRKSLENLDPQKNVFFSKEDLLNNVDAVIQELSSPKEPSRDKYKVPKDILFDLLKQDISEPGLLYKTTSDFLKIDCNYPKEYCETIEKLFLDEKNALVMHEIDNSSIMSKEHIENVRDQIFKNGLRGYGSSGRENLLSATTNSNMLYVDRAESTFIRFKPATLFDFLKSAHTILLLVPKEAIKREKPIWYSNFPNVDSEHPGYIPAKYVVGYTDYAITENGEIDYSSRIFETNKEKNRAEYTYAFLDGQTKDGKSEVSFFMEQISELEKKLGEEREMTTLLESALQKKREENAKLTEENTTLKKQLSVTDVAKSALQKTTTTKADEAKSIEEIGLNPENTKNGEEIDD